MAAPAERKNAWYAKAPLAQEFVGHRVKESLAFERILQAIHDGICSHTKVTLPCQLSPADLESEGARKARLKKRVLCIKADIDDAENPPGFFVYLQTSHQFFMRSLKEYNCRAVYVDGGTEVEWPRSAEEWDKSDWARPMCIETVTVVKSAKKT